MEGFNGTIIAYGQTASGKTYTMTGPDIHNDEQKGLIPRMMQEVFDWIEKSDADIEFSVKVGFCEIYMEKVQDLIEPSR